MTRRPPRLQVLSICASLFIESHYITGFVQEEITKSYSVHAVVDQVEKAKVAFHVAVSRGLIDTDTGEYINNITSIRVPVEEAIERGKSTKGHNLHLRL